jgi:hypothetical protein
VALRFDGANTHKVDVGSGASIDDLAAGTILAWFRLDAFPPANTSMIYTKESSGLGIGWQIQTDSIVRLFITRGAGASEIGVRVASPTGIAGAAWGFMATTWDGALTDTDQHFYSGDLSTIAVEAGSYNVQLVGAGALDSVAAASGVVGNRAANSRQFDGLIGWIGIWNRQLSLGEVRAQQFRPHKTSGCVLFVHLGYAGTGTQPDWSGNGNNGTVTGATVANHVPLTAPFGGELWVPYVVAAPAAGNPWYAYAQS